MAVTHPIFIMLQKLRYILVLTMIINKDIVCTSQLESLQDLYNQKRVLEQYATTHKDRSDVTLVVGGCRSWLKMKLFSIV